MVMDLKEQHHWTNFERSLDGKKPIPFWLFRITGRLHIWCLEIRFRLCRHDWEIEDLGGPENGPRMVGHCKKCGCDINA